MVELRFVAGSNPVAPTGFDQQTSMPVPCINSQDPRCRVPPLTGLAPPADCAKAQCQKQAIRDTSGFFLSTNSPQNLAPARSTAGRLREGAMPEASDKGHFWLFPFLITRYRGANSPQASHRQFGISYLYVNFL